MNNETTSKKWICFEPKTSKIPVYLRFCANVDYFNSSFVSAGHRLNINGSWM